MSRIDKVTYYDFAGMDYASFFLTGFSENESRCDYRMTISRQLPYRLRERMMQGGWASTLSSIGVFKIELGDKESYFCIDTRDSCRGDPDKGMGYHLPLLDEVTLYFKVNYNEEAIRTDTYLRAYAHKIIPVAPCFPLRPRRLLPLLSRIVGSSVTAGSGRIAASRIKALVQLPSLEEIQRLRNMSKEIDIFFVSAFYPEAHHRADMEFRYQIMREVTSHRNLMSVVGFAGKAFGKFAQFKCDRYTLKDYLRELSRAKVAIYVRGLHGCLSFKIGQYLALGMPVVGQTIPNNTRSLYSIEGFSEQFAYDSPRQIVQKAAELLKAPDRLKALGQSNSKAFDGRLTPQVTVSNILENVRSSALQSSEVYARGQRSKALL